MVAALTLADAGEAVHLGVHLAVAEAGDVDEALGDERVAGPQVVLDLGDAAAALADEAGIGGDVGQVQVERCRELGVVVEPTRHVDLGFVVVGRRRRR